MNLLLCYIELPILLFFDDNFLFTGICNSGLHNVQIQSINFELLFIIEISVGS